MTDNTIAFSMVATNAYFTLGLRFLNRFNRFYTGESKVKFYFFSDQDPTEYVPDNIDVTYKPFHHENWLDATNSKSKLMLSLLNENEVGARPGPTALPLSDSPTLPQQGGADLERDFSTSGVHLSDSVDGNVDFH